MEKSLNRIQTFLGMNTKTEKNSVFINSFNEKQNDLKKTVKVIQHMNMAHIFFF